MPSKLYWNYVLLQRRRSDHACRRRAAVEVVLEFCAISAAPLRPQATKQRRPMRISIRAQSVRTRPRVHRVKTIRVSIEIPYASAGGVAFSSHWPVRLCSAHWAARQPVRMQYRVDAAQMRNCDDPSIPADCSDDSPLPIQRSALARCERTAGVRRTTDRWHEAPPPVAVAGDAGGRPACRQGASGPAEAGPRTRRA